MKGSGSAIFIVIIVVILAGIFYALDRANIDKPKTLRETLDCHDEKITDSIMALSGNTTEFRALIGIYSSPLDRETIEELNRLDVRIDPGSQLFEVDPYVRADIPTDSLCDLVELDSIRNIYIPQ